MFDNVEFEPGASNLPASPLVNTVKPLKYPGDIFIRDADPVYYVDILNSIIQSRSFVYCPKISDANTLFHFLKFAKVYTKLYSYRNIYQEEESK